MEDRKIIHIDMDAFYASIEMRDNPRLKTHPIAVGGDPQSRGVIATANYKARKYGVRSAMPSWKAVKLCPDLKIIYPDFKKYKQESEAIHEIFHHFTDLIEPLSLDEAYLDVTHCQIFNGSATYIAKEIRRLIWKERRLTASAGIAPNKFLAKVASDWNKPNGFYTIAPKDVDDFVKELPIENIFGIGRVTAKKFHSLNIYTCGDLQKLDLLELREHFGNRAWNLYELCRGIDHRPVIVDRVRKTLSVETTFLKDLLSLEECINEVPNLYEDLLSRYKKIKNEYTIKKPFLKVKFADFTITRVESIVFPLANLSNYQELMKIAWDRRKQPVRLLGVGFHLDQRELVQLTLF